MVNEGSQLNRRGLLRTGAAATAIAGTAGIAAMKLASAQTPVSADEDVAALGVAIEEKRTLLERISADVTDDTRAVHDRLVSIVDEADRKFREARDATGREATRLYRDIQHLMHEADHEIDKALHAVGHGVETVWNDIRHAARTVHNRVDHVIDSIFHRDRGN